LSIANMPRTDEMEVLQKASSVEGIKVPEKKLDEAGLKDGQVMCYVNGQQAEVKDKWDFINEVANSIPEFNNYMGSCAGAGSGDFHMYRAFRRKERFRLNAMKRDEIRVRVTTIVSALLVACERFPHRRKRIRTTQINAMRFRTITKKR